ncbi:MAG: hypothetical protein R3A46_12790 [Thermomicrobiales bacterium]
MVGPTFSDVRRDRIRERPGDRSRAVTCGALIWMGLQDVLAVAIQLTFLSIAVWYGDIFNRVFCESSFYGRPRARMPGPVIGWCSTD